MSPINTRIRMHTRAIAAAAPLAAWRQGPFSRLERERERKRERDRESSSSVRRQSARPIARTAFFSIRESEYTPNDRESGECAIAFTVICRFTGRLRAKEARRSRERTWENVPLTAYATRLTRRVGRRPLLLSPPLPLPNVPIPSPSPSCARASLRAPSSFARSLVPSVAPRFLSSPLAPIS